MVQKLGLYFVVLGGRHCQKTIAMAIADGPDVAILLSQSATSMLSFGETSSVAAPHRKPAFAVAMEAMDRLKTEVDRYKKEYFENGEVAETGDWIEASLRG
jgi:hypothetical protein